MTHPRLWRRLKTPQRPLFRMPHLVEERHFVELCTRCDACVEACETGVIVRGDGGFPELDFQRAECSFCEACNTACPEPLFLPKSVAPWPYRARLGESCLPLSGIECRSCADACEAQAIRFTPTAGAALPTLTEDCTGCGACLPRCPGQALTLHPKGEAQ
ncbi:ferredoxin-type protein NapF [Ferrimonas balearica]|uniref:ferredoxin-type protein NapF n=1 Tax=Ferrimonas balearica TaxID=44012 RepID=UPI001C990092|nr:ferredoxin-type protein NapF [Ferrimonas balearica]MBY5992900.1 ferredoxin-type protein NapF [Ferrimonas balearica]